MRDRGPSSLFHVLIASIFGALVSFHGCGGGVAGSGSSSGSATRALTVSATAEIPSSSSSSALVVDGSKSAVGSTRCSGGTATLYTIDGVEVATGTISSSGEISLGVESYDLLPPETVSADATSYHSDLVLSCDCNGVLSEIYVSAAITEGDTTSLALGTSNATTTLASQSMATEVGCANWGDNCRSLVTSKSLNLSNLYQAEMAIWEAGDLSGPANQAYVGKIKGLITAFFAGGGTAKDAGYSTPAEFMRAVMKGEVSSLASIAPTAASVLGVDSSLFSDYATAASSYKQMKGVVRDYYLSVAGEFDNYAKIQNAMKVMLVNDDVTQFNDARAFRMMKQMYDECEESGTTCDASKVSALVEQYSGGWDTVCPTGEVCNTGTIEALFHTVAIPCGSTVPECRDEMRVMKQTIESKGLDYFKTGGSFDASIFQQVGQAALAVTACATCLSSFNASTVDQFIPTASTLTSTSTQSCLDIAAQNGTDPRNCYATTTTTDGTTTGSSGSKVNGESCSAGSECSSGICSVNLCSASRHYVYVANNLGNSISAFSMNASTGVLTAVSSSQYTTGTNPSDLVITPDGKFLYTANSLGNSISGFSINSSTGALTALTGSPYATGPSTVPMGLAISPDSRYLYAAYAGTDQIQPFHINSTSGVLTANGSVVTASDGPQKLAFVTTPLSNNFLYSTANGTGDMVWGFPVNSDGRLGTLAPHELGQDTMALAADPAGKWLYAVEFSVTSLMGMTINASSGSLTNMNDGIAYTNASPNRGVVVQPNGEHLYISNGGSSTVCIFAINSSTGALAYEGDSNCADMGETGDAEFITIDPQGKFLFAVHSGQNAVWSFSINASTGTLSSVGSYSVGSTPGTVKVIGITQ